LIKEKKRMKFIEDKMKDELLPQELILDEIKVKNKAAANQSKYIHLSHME